MVTTETLAITAVNRMVSNFRNHQTFIVEETMCMNHPLVHHQRRKVTLADHSHLTRQKTLIADMGLKEMRNGLLIVIDWWLSEHLYSKQGHG